MARNGRQAGPGDNRPVALVTGGGRRIGAAIVHELARVGFLVVLTYRESREAADALAARAAGVALPLDLRRPDSFPPFAGHFRETFGRLDLLVHNAALFPRTPIGEVTVSVWDEVFAVNTRAPFLLTQACLPLLLASPGPPAIVFLGDAGASRLWPSYIPYCLSKVAVEAEAKALAKALSPAVRVGLVRPGLALRAEDFPEERWDALRAKRKRRGPDSPDKVARAVASFVKRAKADSHILKA